MRLRERVGHQPNRGVADGVHRGSPGLTCAASRRDGGAGRRQTAALGMSGSNGCAGGLGFVLLAQHLPVALGRERRRRPRCRAAPPGAGIPSGWSWSACACRSGTGRRAAECRRAAAPSRRLARELSCTRPPSATIWPSSTSTVDSMERLLVMMPAGLVVVLHAGDLLEDLQPHGAAFGDLRLDAQRQADVLALDGLERRRGGRASGLRVLPGDERARSGR